MRNTLILTEQIKENLAAGLDDYHAVIEATVQRTRPVILTALAAVLAFIPLTHFRVLGIDGLHADRRHGGRHGTDSAVSCLRSMLRGFRIKAHCRSGPSEFDGGNRHYDQHWLLSRARSIRWTVWGLRVGLRCTKLL